MLVVGYSSISYADAGLVVDRGVASCYNLSSRVIQMIAKSPLIRFWLCVKEAFALLGAALLVKEIFGIALATNPPPHYTTALSIVLIVTYIGASFLFKRREANIRERG